MYGFGHFGAPLGAPENFYTFYAPLVSFSFIFRAILVLKIRVNAWKLNAFPLENS